MQWHVQAIPGGSKRVQVEALANFRANESSLADVPAAQSEDN